MGALRGVAATQTGLRQQGFGTGGVDAAQVGAARAQSC
jgi:hypothetical protein